jgi:hypothetical protein
MGSACFHCGQIATDTVDFDVDWFGEQFQSIHRLFRGFAIFLDLVFDLFQQRIKFPIQLKERIVTRYTARRLA